MELKINPRVWTFIILISLGAIILAAYLITNEILEARDECNAIEGKYDLKITGHYCNGKKFIKVMDCKKNYNGADCKLFWEFEDEINKINVSEWVK